MNFAHNNRWQEVILVSKNGGAYYDFMRMGTETSSGARLFVQTSSRAAFQVGGRTLGWLAGF